MIQHESRLTVADNTGAKEISAKQQSLSKNEKEVELSVCVLASGSKGNAIFISDGVTSLLIDAGFSGVEIERRLKVRGIKPEDIDAILVSHEHGDHIKGVGVLARRYDLPVYINEKTLQAASSQLGSIDNKKIFECGSSFIINKLKIHPFSISHDAADTTGFTVKKNKIKVGIATDLGIATSMVKEHLKGSSLLVLEANHDPEMLSNGPYPWYLKQRIKGRTGHLSNVDSKKLLKEIKHDQLGHVILAHLSGKNNTPDKALCEVGLSISDCNTKLHVATQEKCGEMINLF